MRPRPRTPHTPTPTSRPLKPSAAWTTTAPSSSRRGDTEREVGQFPDASKEEALALYARRFLDLKAKLDLLASRLTSPNVKSP